MSCPTKNKEWSRLVKYSGDETTAYRIYRAHGGKTPSVPSITELKKSIKFKMRIFTGLEKALLNIRVGGYNKRNNTSHSIDYSKLSEGTQKAELVMNFFPKSVNSVIPKTKVTARASDVRVESPVDPSDIYIGGDNQFIVGGEVFSSYEDANNHIRNNIKKKNNVELKQAWELNPSNVSDALDSIVKNSSWSNGVSIAKQLKKYSSDTSIDIVDNDSFIKKYNEYLVENNLPLTNLYNVSAAFLPNSNTILLRENASEDTILHEITHALTLKVLSDPNNKQSKEFSKLFKEAKTALIEAGMDRNEYGLSNMEEFVSELMGNEDFANALKNIPSTKNKSIFENILEFLRSIFGATESMYDKAFEATIAIMDSQDTMNSVDYHEHNPRNAEEISEGFKKLSNALKDINNRLGQKIKISRRSSITVENELANSISSLVKDVQTREEQGEYLDATLELFNQLMDQEISFLSQDVSYYREGSETSEPMNSAYLNRMKTSVDLYGSIARDIKDVLDQQYIHNELIPIAAATSELISKFDGELAAINSFVRSQTKAEGIKLVEEIVGRENLDRPVEQMLRDIDTDVSQASVYFGSIKDSPDQIMRAIYKLVVFQKMETDRVALSKGKDLLAAQLRLEKAGVKDTSIFHEMYDGKKTGYLISNVNWGEYFETKKIAKKAYLKELNKLGIVTMADMPSNEELKKDPKLNDKIVAARERTMTPWRNKYERLVEGSWAKNPPINEEYRKMIKNPAVDKNMTTKEKAIREYYETFIEMQKLSKSLLPNSYNNTNYGRLLLPQIRKTTMEIMKSKNKVLKGLGNRVKESLLKSDQDTDFGHDEVVEDAAGNPAKLIPIHYSVRMSDTDDISDDMTSMATAYFEMAHKFNGMSGKLDDIVVIQRALEESGASGAGRKFKKGKGRSGNYQNSNIAKALENFLDMQVFGVKENPMEFKVPGTNKVVKVSKLLDLMLNFVRKNNLFLSISSISGAAKTGFDLASDIASKNYVTAESVAWAHKEFAKNLGSVISGVGKREKSGKFNLMAEYNGIYGGINEIFAHMNMKNKLARFSDSDYTYFTYTVPDLFYKGVLSLAVYNDYRLVDGKYVTSKQFKRNNKDANKKWSDYSDKTLYQAYETVGNKFKVKDEFKEYVTPELENTVKYTIEERGAILSGQLTQYDRAQASRTILGKFVLLHRNWILSGIPERTKKAVRNEQTGEIEEGYYRSTLHLAGRFLAEKGNIKQKIAVWDTLQDFEKMNVHKFLADFAFFVGILLLSNLMQSLADDEPDEYWLQFLAFMFNRIRLEQAAFFKMKEAMSIINSPTAAGNLLDTLFGMTKLLGDWEKIEYGAYEDMYHIQKAMIKNSRLKNIWEMRNNQGVSQKNKYIVTQVL